MFASPGVENVNTAAARMFSILRINVKKLFDYVPPQLSIYHLALY